MKKFLFISLIFFTACSQNSNEKAVSKAKAAEAQVTKPVNDYKGIKFASEKDLSCGMPLSAGVEDTVHYNGKIYGFCSIECKETFLKDPQKYLAKK